MKCIACNNDIKVNGNRCSKCGCMVASAESVYFFEWLPADKTVTRSHRKLYEITERRYRLYLSVQNRIENIFKNGEKPKKTE